VLVGRDGVRRSIGCLHFAEASGLDTYAIALLLPACEAGLLKSLRTLAA
jgi:hypothetical protein